MGPLPIVETQARTNRGVVMKPGASQEPGRDGGPEQPPAPERKRVRYSIKFVCGTAGADCGCCCPVQPGAYATQISIHNYSQERVVIHKHFFPLVLAGAPVGREPKVATSRAEDKIELPPHTATMDDCCRIGELLFGAPVEAVTIGLMEIVATRDVAVSAIYTTATGIDVVPVLGRTF